MTPGYSAIAAYHPKTEANVGTLWRSARTFRASMIATVGPRRYEHQGSDTCRAYKSMPLVAFTDIDDLIGHLPFGCQLVGVELSDRAVSLTRFQHPHQALYLLGAEDNGIPDAVLTKCHHVVQIPSPEPWSLNVAVAGSLILSDRYIKRTKAFGGAT